MEKANTTIRKASYTLEIGIRIKSTVMVSIFTKMAIFIQVLSRTISNMVQAESNRQIRIIMKVLILTLRIVLHEQ